MTRLLIHILQVISRLLVSSMEQLKEKRMIVAITIILIVAMICGSCLLAFYWALIHDEVNEYTLRDVKRTVERIEDLILKMLEEKMDE